MDKTLYFLLCRKQEKNNGGEVTKKNIWLPTIVIWLEYKFQDQWLVKD